jgi:hypothetical protein
MEPETSTTEPVVDAVESTRQLLYQINAALDLTVGKLVTERNSKRIRHHQRVIKHLITGQKQVQDLLKRLIQEKIKEEEEEEKKEEETESVEA